MKTIIKSGLVLSFLFFLNIKAFADQPSQVQDLTNMSLEDLMNTKVTSASGREQKQREVASSMFVITKEDVKRWGAHNIPDLFYHVPGMQVRKIDGNRYFVSIRNFGIVSKGSLLVLVDNVIVFNPLKDGVNWELLPVTLDEIERIEIIRGPGGTLYSSNAIDGVINIITKKASDHDNYVATKAGSMHFLQDNVGVGQKIGNLSVRGFYQGDHDSGFSYQRGVSTTSPTTGDKKEPNTANDQIAGLKAQYDFSPDTSLLLDAKDNEFTGDNNGSPIATSPGGTTFKRPGYQRAFSAQFQQKVNDVYDYNIHLDAMSEATSLDTGDDQKSDSYTFNTQHNLKYDFFGSQVTSFGLEARYIKLNDHVDFLPPADPHQTQKVDSFFLQDEYRPTDKLILTAGLRLTGNTDVTPKEGLLYEPRWSAVYLLNDEQTLRAVISKSYETPGMYSRDAVITVIPNLLDVRGSETLDAEEKWNYETGWHGIMLDKKLDLDAAVYYSQLKNPYFPSINSSITTSPTLYYANGVSGLRYLPVTNDGSVYTYGTELSAKYKLTEDLSINGDYTFTNANPDMNFDPSVGYARAYSLDMSKHQAGVGLSYTKNSWTIDLYAKWIDKYTDTALNTGKYPSYWNSTIRVAYAFKMPFMKMKENDAEFELVGNDLFGAHTVESTNLYQRQPDAYAGLKVKF